MTAVDIDRETAHEAARRELAKPIYSAGSLPQRIDEWIHRLLARVVEQGASVPGGWLTIVVLIALLAASVAVAIRVVRRTIRTRAGADRPVFGAGQLSAAQHRDIAESAAGQQDWSDAIRHRLRAVARLLEEDGILDSAPGRTAGELGADAGSALPALASEFLEAATIFDDVVYGEHAGTAAGYQAIADLDDRVCRAARTGHPGSGAPIRSASWTPVR